MAEHKLKDNDAERKYHLKIAEVEAQKGASTVTMIVLPGLSGIAPGFSPSLQ